MMVLQACLALILICQVDVEAKAQYHPYLKDILARLQQEKHPDSSLQSERQLPALNFLSRTTTITSTITESTTTYAVFTCTVSTTNCAGRRRRAVISEHFLEQYLNPSPINSIEPTLLELDTPPSNPRERREADPQHYLHRPPYDLSSSPERDAVVQPSLSGYGLFANSFIGDYLWSLFYSNNSPAQTRDGQMSDRQGNIFGARVTSTVFVTTTKCFALTSTFTSRPSCNLYVGLPKCPK